MRFTTLFIDLDDTLYPSGNGLWEAIRERMTLYMMERLQIPEENVSTLRRSYYETYGTTLRGLQHHYPIDADDFLAFVHDLPLGSYLRPDPALRELLLGLPQRKWIFTNADAPHARRVLSQLDLAGIFDGIVDVKAVEFACKPHSQAYERAMTLAGESQPDRCVLIDDSPRNLAPARALGFFTVLVGSDQPDPSSDLSITSLNDLPQTFPQLWNSSSAVGEETGWTP